MFRRDIEPLLMPFVREAVDQMNGRHKFSAESKHGYGLSTQGSSRSGEGHCPNDGCNDDGSGECDDTRRS